MRRGNLIIWKKESSLNNLNRVQNEEIAALSVAAISRLEEEVSH